MQEEARQYRLRSRAQSEKPPRHAFKGLSPDDEERFENEFRKLNQERRQQIANNSIIDERATAPSNIHKNRYEDVLPYRDTAVRLNAINGSDSDYINANWVQDRTTSVGKKQLYICAQAPLTHTFADFWRMVWEKDVPVIVMITNIIEKNRRKADRYWPHSPDEEARYGTTKVKLVKELTRGPNVIIRTFHIWQEEPAPHGNDSGSSPFVSGDEDQDINYNSVELAEEESDEKLYISNENPGPSDDKSGQESSPSQSYGLMTPTPTKTLPGKEVRSVVQLHCTKWPDHGVPKSTKVMKDLIRELDLQKKEWKKPILVHCSAGIGRTGTFVAIHMCLNKDLHKKPWTVFDIVKHLRDQRLGMVQSIEQYKFVSIVVNDIIEERNKHRARVGDKKEIEEKEAEAINNEAANTTGVNPNPLSRSTDKKANFLCMSMAAEPFILRQSKDVEKPEVIRLCQTQGANHTTGNKLL